MPYLPPIQGVPKVSVNLRWSQSGFEEARFPTNRLLRAIAGGTGKLRIDVLDQAGAVGDDDGYGALLNRLRELAQFLGPIADPLLKARLRLPQRLIAFPQQARLPPELPEQTPFLGAGVG